MAKTSYDIQLQVDIKAQCHRYITECFQVVGHSCQTHSGLPSLVLTLVLNSTVQFCILEKELKVDFLSTIILQLWFSQSSHR